MPRYRQTSPLVAWNARYAQITVCGAGRLDAGGARGGPAHAAAQPLAPGRFDLFFDIGTSRPELARDLAVYTFQSRITGKIVTSTDPRQGIRAGQLAHLNRFKVPSLRGLASRAPYFHNGIAADLLAVVRHYESELGFVYTPEQEAELVAFLEAL